jgi:chromosomal replication initiator protein
MAAISLRQHVDLPQTSAPDGVNPLPRRFDFPTRVTVAQVLEATAAHYGMSPADLVSDTRRQPVVRRRQIGMYAARKITGRSFKFIANKFGRIDHSTSWHAVQAVQARLDAGKLKTALAVNQIVAKIGGAHD